ncbi:serine/threonine-protein kinase [Streptomyces sp. TP-A0874]|uniref:serine/threonine-protein kinase n=1 Tax=Streptomyces sp. TP-A0874 TaxID=549819 RepID=UPI000852C5C4|nr:serine/threonine-protein kinase [Streptomyces sp. TP-A0874]
MGRTRLIRGRYRLLETIGRGGMGEVWRALDEALERQVAVKCLKPAGRQLDHSSGGALRERFRREARVAAALQHRGVTVVHDFGEESGSLFLVMEYLDGRDLGQLLTDNGGPLPVAETVEIAEQVAAALDHTHGHGIVHRDLKPANIMRTGDGTVKICDFGIARLGQDIGFTARLSGTGAPMGTPPYMSPEQIAGATVDHRSDLYSLGCVLYELSTGTPPFGRGDPWPVLIGHRDTAPVPPRAHRPEIPRYLEEIVLGLLAKAPEDRPQRAADVVDRLTVARRPPWPSESWADPAPDGLPPWAAGMTAGHRTDGAAAGETGKEGGRAALTAGWTPRYTSNRSEAAPGALASLARRHSAGLHLAALGHWEEASEIYRSVIAEREVLLGPEHPDTLASRRELAVALGRLGGWEEALALSCQVARSRERALGVDHPDTVTSLADQAYFLERLGRPVEATRLHRRLSELSRTAACGP